MFLEYLSEAREVKRLVVLQQNDTQIEFTESQFDIVHFSYSRLLFFGFIAQDRELCKHTLSSASTDSKKIIQNLYIICVDIRELILLSFEWNIDFSKIKHEMDSILYIEFAEMQV